MYRLFTQWSHHSLLFLPLLLCLLVPDLAAAGEDDNSNSAFHIECPPDTTVGCDAEIWDLSGFGTAYIYGYGSPQPAGDPISVDYDLNSCGAGTITRTWVAYDYGNNPYYCSQIIYVSGGGYVHINWPPDYTISDCGQSSTDPEDLPPPYDFPVINDYGSECTQIMMNYEDLVFDINAPACVKILRTWTVINWCEYDPNDWYPTGIWEHTQVIKIKPDSPPTIQCPADLTASAGADCSGGYVHIPPATGTAGCGGDAIITNHSPYADHGGADASGHYPIGTTKVIFKAKDGCGGYTECAMYVTVIDMKAPTPICYYGVTVTLMQMPDGYYMDLQPHFFDKGSFDNCTPDHKLVFDVEPKRVDCAHIGTTPVKVYVTDESGNSAYCNTIVSVQDNLGICPPNNGLIQGAVSTPDGSSLEDVQVNLVQASAYDMTDNAGDYGFDDVPFWADYTVYPENPEHVDMDGVSTMDLLIMLKHILGMETIVDPYTLLAADINGSGKVDVHDLLELKELVIQNHYNIEVGTEWTFVDAGFEFADPQNPFAEPIPAMYQISNFETDMVGLDFIGVKRGDLSGEVNYPEFQDEEIAVRSQPLQLRAPDIAMQAGERYTVRIAAENLNGVEGYKLALDIDTDKVKVLTAQVAEHVLAGGIPAAIATRDKDKVLVIGLDAQSAVQEDQVLLTIELEALKDGQLDKCLSLARGDSETEIYLTGNQVRSAELNFEVPSQKLLSQDQPISEVSAYPNPFVEQTQIQVSCAEASELLIEVFDAQGQVVLTMRHQARAGTNTIPLNADRMGVAGVYVCRISTENQSMSLRIVSQKWE